MGDRFTSRSTKPRRYVAGFTIFSFVSAAVASAIHSWPSIQRFLTSWPDLNRYTIASLLLGASGLAFNIHRVRKATSEAERLQQDALREFQQRVLNRLNHDQLLVSIDAVRALALGIELKYRCGMITDKLVCEVIRGVALDVELHDSGDSLHTKLLLLDSIVSELDADHPRLMSIAVVDRIYAYRQSEPVFVAAICIALVALTTVTSGPALLAGGSAAVLLILGLGIAAYRAELFWKYDSRETTPRTSRWLRPTTPSVLLDFFLVACLSRDRWAWLFWHQAWAPFWETVPLFLRYANAPSKIVLLHTFRYKRAQELYRELRRIQRDFDKAEISGHYIRSPDEQQRFVQLCRDLWVVTGDDTFRAMERSGSIISVGNSDPESIVHALQ